MKKTTPHEDRLVQEALVARVVRGRLTDQQLRQDAKGNRALIDYLAREEWANVQLEKVASRFAGKKWDATV